MAGLALVPKAGPGGARGSDQSTPRFTNRLLRAAGGAADTLGLEPVNLRRGHMIYGVDDTIRQVYFVDRGIISLVKTMRDGRTVEIGAVGTEGVAGISALFDVDTSIFEAIVQVPGSAFRASVANVRRAMAANPQLHDLLEGYVHVVMGQIAQTAACNRLHSLEERCCRWLLICEDSAGSAEFPLTHEFLAMMLGVRRVSVSIVAAGLQKLGFIKYRHGRITVANRAAVETHACECYATIKAQTDRLFGPGLRV